MIYLIRHTRPDVGSGVCYGQSDVPLANSFADEALVVERKLTTPSDAVIFSSPLQRCQKLAKKLFSDSQIEVDDRLMEMDFGDWEMQVWESIDQAKLTYWGDNFVSSLCPDGESLELVHRRVISFWNTLDHLNQDYVLVTHAGVVRVVLAHLLGAPLSKSFTLSVGYGEVIKVDYIDHDSCTVKFLS